MNHDSYPQPSSEPLLAAAMQRYPRLFTRGVAVPYSYISPGWATLIDDLLRSIDALLSDEQAARFRVIQVKEKFGTLRLYWSLQRESGPAGADVLESGPCDEDDGAKPGQEARDTAVHRAIRDAVDAACQRSGDLCESCGAASTLRERAGWWSTCCEACLQARLR